MLNKIKILLVGLLLISILPAVYNTPRNIDNTIAFQGYLTDAAGKPLFGTVSMNFDFYNHETSTDEVEVITNNTDLERRVQVFNGQYATKLALPENILTLLNNNQNIWVEVKLGTTTLRTLTPRVQLTAAAQALSVRGIYYDNTQQTIKIGTNYKIEEPSSDTDLIVSGRVGIGTNDPSPQAKLDVNGNMNLAAGSTMTVNGTITPNAIDGNTGGVDGAVWN